MQLRHLFKSQPLRDNQEDLFIPQVYTIMQAYTQDISGLKKNPHSQKIAYIFSKCLSYVGLSFSKLNLFPTLPPELIFHILSFIKPIKENPALDNRNNNAIRRIMYLMESRDRYRRDKSAWLEVEIKELEKLILYKDHYLLSFNDFTRLFKKYATLNIYKDKLYSLTRHFKKETKKTENLVVSSSTNAIASRLASHLMALTTYQPDHMPDDNKNFFSSLRLSTQCFLLKQTIIKKDFEMAAELMVLMKEYLSELDIIGVRLILTCNNLEIIELFAHFINHHPVMYTRIWDIIESSYFIAPETIHYFLKQNWFIKHIGNNKLYNYLLHHIRNQNDKIISMLLLDTKTYFCQKGKLDIAARYGLITILKKLTTILPAIDLNLCNVKGEAPLHIAINYNQLEVALYLLERGADICLPNSQGKTALELCSDKLKSHILPTLLRNNAHILIHLNHVLIPTLEGIINTHPDLLFGYKIIKVAMKLKDKLANCSSAIDWFSCLANHFNRRKNHLLFWQLGDILSEVSLDTILLTTIARSKLACYLLNISSEITDMTNQRADLREYVIQAIQQLTSQAPDNQKMMHSSLSHGN